MFIKNTIKKYIIYEFVTNIQKVLTSFLIKDLRNEFVRKL